MTTPSLLDRVQAWLPLAPLLVLLGGTYWLSQQVLPLPPKPDDSKRHDPDYIVRNFSATTLNQQGAPRYIVDAQKMEHYPDDDSTHLEEPHLYSLYADAPPVSIAAKTGQISKNGNEVFLHDEVRVVREASATQSEMVVTTNYLHVIPDRDFAETDRPITVKDAHSVTSAIGMKLDARAREIKLLAQVRGQYDAVRR